MNVIREYALPTNERSENFEFECPLFFDNGKIYYISPAEKDRPGKKILHMIDTEKGLGGQIILEGRFSLSSDFFFEKYNEKIIIYAGDLFVCDENSAVKKFCLFSKGKINSHFVDEKFLYLVCGKFFIIFDMERSSVVCEKNISNNSPYFAGELSFLKIKFLALETTVSF